ncbi:hypothetical protein EBZ80_04465 [bacterium]|nr:hypothetical protein [bacterium]
MQVTARSEKNFQDHELRIKTERLPDGGPVYVETPDDLAAVHREWRVAEPYNTVSAALFALLALAWLRKLRREHQPSTFLTGCMGILLVGGVGGTLYHGTRASKWFFLMDVGPIFLLVAVASLWLWQRSARTGTAWAILLVLGIAQLFAFLRLPPQDAVNASYLLLAAMLFIPLAWNLKNDKSLGIRWVALAVLSFGIAFFFRVADAWGPEPLIPMGTHWLWHMFGCVSCGGLIKYMHVLMTADACRDVSHPAGEGVTSGGERREVA